MTGLTNDNTIYEIHDFENNKSPSISADALDKMELGIKEAVENRAQNIIIFDLSLSPDNWVFSDNLVYVYNTEADFQFNSLKEQIKNKTYIEIMLNTEVTNSNPNLIFYLSAYFDEQKNIKFVLNNIGETPITTLNLKLQIQNNVLIKSNYVWVNTGGVRDNITLDPLDSIFINCNQNKNGKKDYYNWELASQSETKTTVLTLNNVSTNSIFYPSTSERPKLKFKGIKYNNCTIDISYNNSIEQYWFGPNNILVRFNKQTGKIDVWNQRAENNNSELFSTIYNAQSFESKIPTVAEKSFVFLNEQEFIVKGIEYEKLSGVINITLHAEIYRLKEDNIIQDYFMNKFTITDSNIDVNDGDYVVASGSAQIGINKRGEDEYYFWVYHTGATYYYAYVDRNCDIDPSLNLVYYNYKTKNTTIKQNFKSNNLSDNATIVQAKNYCIFYQGMKMYNYGGKKPTYGWIYVYYLNFNNQIEERTFDFTKNTTWYSGMYLKDIMHLKTYNTSLPYVNSENNLYLHFGTAHSNGEIDSWPGMEISTIVRFNSNGILTNIYDNVPLDLIPVNKGFISIETKTVYNDNLTQIGSFTSSISKLYATPSLLKSNLIFLQKEVNSQGFTINYNNYFYFIPGDTLIYDNTGFDLEALPLSEQGMEIKNYIDIYGLQGTNESTFFNNFQKNTSYINPLNNGFNQSFNYGFAKNNLFNSSGGALHFDTENFTSDIVLPIMPPIKDNQNQEVAYYWIKVRED